MTMKSLLEKLEDELIIRNYALNTRNEYRVYVKQYLLFSSESDIDDRNQRIYSYLLSFGEKSTARSIARAALKFFYASVVRTVPFPEFPGNFRKKKRLPSFLSRREFDLLINKIRNPIHKAMIMTMFGAGLRVSEVISLKVKDLYFESKLIRVNQSKGNKDRYTVFPRVLMNTLESVIQDKKKTDYVFTTVHANRYSIRTVQKIVSHAAQKAEIKKNISCHTLRHSFATVLLSNGCDIKYIQEMLGHKSLNTTSIYTHVIKPDISRIKSPLD